MKVFTHLGSALGLDSIRPQILSVLPLNGQPKVCRLHHHRRSRPTGLTSTDRNVLDNTVMETDTPRVLPARCICNRLDGDMAITTPGRGGRKSKGDRKLVGSRMPVNTAAELEAVAEARGVTISDYVADLVTAHLATIDISRLRTQEELPIIRAS